MAQVRFDRVTKIFDSQQPALTNFFLEVKDGEFVVLVGPSGCGKTTALRLLAGLEEPTAGDLFIGERRVNTIPPKDRDVAMVFQNYALYPHMTVYENLAFPLKVRHIVKNEIDRRVRETAELLGLAPLLSRKPKALSGGERQRVAVGRALVRQPQVFLFDEPLSNLDAALRSQLRGELLHLKTKLGATALYVTHDQVEALTLGDRVAVLKAGELQQVGSPGELYRRPQNLFVATFIGTPPMNLIRARVFRQDGLFCHEVFRWRVPPPQAEILEAYVGREIILGLRPDILRVVATDADASGMERFPISIDFMEPIGGEMLLHGTAAGTPVIITERRVMGERKVSPGEKITCAFEWRQVHLFDPASGQRISFPTLTVPP